MCSFVFGVKNHLTQVHYLPEQTSYNSIAIDSIASIVVLDLHGAITADAHSDHLIVVVNSSDKSSRTIPSD